MKANRTLSIIVGILMIIAGFYCIAAPEIADAFLIWIMIGSLFVSAIVNICSWGKKRKAGQANGWNLAGSIISLILAIVLVVNLGARILSLVILMYIIMGWMVVMGIIRISYAVKTRNDPVLGRMWVLTLVMGILMILAGLSGLARPLGAALAIGMVVGINFVVCGFSYVLGSAEE